MKTLETTRDGGKTPRKTSRFKNILKNLPLPEKFLRRQNIIKKTLGFDKIE
jgi:hypothetical protein